jgi:hypothetical protein
VTGRARIRALGVALLGLSLAGCVAPAPNDPAYESKAAMTAQAAVSASRTALLTTRAYLHDRLPGSYLEPVLVDSEQALDSVRSTFDSVQPPASGAADSLRSTLDPLLESAGSAVTELRIAARRGRARDLSATAADLTGLADRLDAFAREHGG